MLPRLDPRGWLLVAIAGWALLCAIVALTGFGGSYHLLPDDPTRVQRLPPVVTANTHASLGPLEAYADATNRPLFYPDRKPITVHVPGQNDAAQALDVILTSVIMTPTLQMAIVQDPKTKESLRVREGQAIGGAYSGWKLVSLSPRQAAFENAAQNQTTLNLRVFDGQGGDEPTRLGLTPQAVASGVLGTPHPPPQRDAQPSDDSNPAVNQAAMAATEAAQQAEQIRQRIEERRRQAQAQAGDTQSPNDKR